MKVWINTEFEGFYPVGTAAVVVANTVEEATALLNEELAKIGLPQSATANQFKQVPTDQPTVVVLRDGDY